jgi:fructoselysine-6-P-deglycase FrlB-like protein
MNARMSRLATIFVILVSLGGSAFASPFTKPALVRTAAQQARSEKLSELAKKHDRDEKGRLLPKVSHAAVRLPAYDKQVAKE